MKHFLGRSTLLSSLLALSNSSNASPIQDTSPAFGSHMSQKRQDPAWTPPEELVVPLQQVWEHEMATYPNPLTFANWGYDQVMAGQGRINYCVRWESNEPVTHDMRAQIQDAIRLQFNHWMAVLADFEGWPYPQVEVNTIAYAVRDPALLLDGPLDIDVHTTLDDEGIPQCDPRCGRFFNQDGNYADCPLGPERHYDMSLWLTDGFGGGHGGDWGQRMGQEYFMDNIREENMYVVLHEIGHSFALDDFYDWTPEGMDEFLMKANTADHITDFDAWMARDWWRNIKSRFGL